MKSICEKKLHPDIRIEWPTHAEMEDSAKWLKENRPNGQTLFDIFGVIDGGRLPCADYTDSDIQNVTLRVITSQ